MMKNFFTIMLLLLAGFAHAQVRSVSGVVTDGGQPLAGATVSVKGSTVATMTDVQGRYQLAVQAGATLVFAYLGKQTHEVMVADQSTINAELKDNAQALEDVVVVAYGTAKKESMVGSAGTVSAKQLSKRVVANVTKALEGAVAGIQVTSGSGQPGSGASIRVRGFGSINSSNDPLYVVDGAPYDGSMAALNPDDIASITILKDASAGALYGARGANGVVLVTTKRGAEGSLRVTAKAVWGVTSRAIDPYETLNEREFLEASFMMYKNAAVYDEGLAPSAAGAAAVAAMGSGNNRLLGENEQYNPFNMPLASLIDPSTGKVNPDANLRYHQSWMDEVTAPLPLRQEYSLNLAGGDRRTRYFVSFGYLNEQGLQRETGFSRLSGRLNLDSQATPWLKLGGSLSVAFNKTDNQPSSSTGSNNVWYAAQMMAPIYPVFELDENAGVKHDETGKPLYDYGLNRPNGAANNFNCVAMLFEDKYYSNSDNLTVRGYTELGLYDESYGLAQGLTFKVDISASNQNGRGTTYYNPLFGNAGPPTNGRLTKTSSRGISYTFNQIAGYNHSFDQHAIDFILGHEFYSLIGNNLSAQMTGFPFPGIFELNPGTTVQLPSSSQESYNVESVLSRFKYSFADKYNFEASLRTDGSSRFHRDSRWGVFWSVGVNWRMSEEDFLRSQKSWLNNLSFRASYGEQGNDAVGTYYAWQSFYDLSWANANNNGSVLSSLESRDLKWEKNGNFNIGIEARIFDRLNITADVYKRITTDMLLEVPMAPSLGFSSYLDNIGSMENTGFELLLAIDLIKHRSFAWKLTAIGAMVRNKITQLATDKPIISGTMIYKVGEPIHSWYLPRSAGVDPGNGQQLYYVWDTRDPVTDERTSDIYISADPSKAATSREAVGSKEPDFSGSFSSEFTLWKNIDISFLTSYSVGGRTLDNMYASLMEPTYAGQTMHRDVLRAWQNPGDITDIPRLELASSNRSTQSHLIDASYFAIRNLTVGYTLPERWLHRLSFDTARIYLAADNLYTFTALQGFDPQGSLTSSLSYNYVPIRTISIGLNLAF
jgi:TonB-linked SusC/RagA family outer membrane protein